MYHRPMDGKAERESKTQGAEGEKKLRKQRGLLRMTERETRWKETERGRESKKEKQVNVGRGSRRLWGRGRWKGGDE